MSLLPLIASKEGPPRVKQPKLEDPHLLNVKWGLRYRFSLSQLACKDTGFEDCSITSLESL